jgi:hypothetical protein
MKTPPRPYHVLNDDVTPPDTAALVDIELKKIERDWADTQERQMNSDEEDEARDEAKMKALEKELRRLKKEQKRRKLTVKAKPKPKKQSKTAKP